MRIRSPKSDQQTNICYGKMIYFVLVVDGNRAGRHFERYKFLLSVIVLRERFLSSQQTVLLLILKLIFLFLPRIKKIRRGEADKNNQETEDSGDFRVHGRTKTLPETPLFFKKSSSF